MALDHGLSAVAPVEIVPLTCADYFYLAWIRNNGVAFSEKAFILWIAYIKPLAVRFTMRASTLLLENENDISHGIAP